MDFKQLLLKLLPRRTEFVAVDVGNRYIKMAEVSLAGSQPVILNLARVPTPRGALDGNWDEETFTRVLSEAVAEAGIENREVIAAIGGEKVITRLVRVPIMPAKELEKAVVVEAEKSIPIPMEDLIVRHVVLGEVESDGNKLYNLLLSAISSDFVYRFCGFFAQVGAVVAALDLQALALYRVFYHYFASANDNEALALLDIGASNTTLVVVHKKAIVFLRNIAAGGDMLTVSMAETYGISFEEAQELKETSGKIMSAEEAASAFSPEDMQLDISLREGLGNLTREIVKSLEYYNSQPGVVPVSRIILSGGTANLSGFVSFMREALELPVDLGSLPVYEYGDMEQNPTDACFAIAMGLALREFETDS